MNDLAPDGVAIQAAMLDAISDAMSAAILIYDRDDNLVFASHRLFTLLPLEKTEVAPGARLKDVLGAIYDRAGFGEASSRGNRVDREEWIAKSLAAHWAERSETVEQRPGDRWLRFTKRRVPSGFCICAISDITEQKRREEHWRADIERVQITEEILDNLPLSIFVKDKNRIYSAVNKAGCSLIETSPDLILGRNVFDIHSDDLATRIDAMDRQVLETGVPAILPEMVTLLTGDEILVITRKHRVGKPGQYFLVTTMDDVTAFAMTQPDGRRIIPGLEHLSFLRSSYMDDENHQASLVMKGRRVLLVMPNAEAGQAACKRLSTIGVDCAVAVGLQEQEAFLSLSASMGVKIDLVVVDVQLPLECLDLPTTFGIGVMMADEFEIGSSLVNMLTHHFRSLENTQQGRGKDDDWVVINSDDESLNRPRLDVLVVEDNKINQIVFSQILEGLQIEYRLAQSGNEALALFQSEKPSVVLLDTTLPDIDGFEVARQIRRLESSTGERTPLIGVVPLAFEGDQRACLNAGMDEMLLKPISPDIIDMLLKRFLPRFSHSLHG
ncbi:response regulator [Agrobacterium cavarae]|uniref:response regulator n=1 Tax=Agrobacterium cavarae TaxID=2528239 RepID=UPI0028A008DF|nr:response regulator [Agrobacterium cavarae]